MHKVPSVRSGATTETSVGPVYSGQVDVRTCPGTTRDMSNLVSVTSEAWSGRLSFQSESLH